MPYVLTPGSFTTVNASSAIAQANLLNQIATNLAATSGTLNASCANMISNQLQGSAQVIYALVTQGQLGMQTSS